MFIKQLIVPNKIDERSAFQRGNHHTIEHGTSILWAIITYSAHTRLLNFALFY